ncbi:hypothetical protein BDZ89DRAFT_30795 [Hymenopellis radicata]|nr:hypothetical protein BDZ89DRAFT_30795 [Hymenopellis radicata]
MSLLFGHHFTRFYFPRTHEKLSRVVFAAKVVKRLTFLRAATLSPPSSPVDNISDDVVFAGLPVPFVKPKNDWFIWHCRFYHPGKQATTDMLTGSYATGIDWDGKIMNCECPSCIMGRLPAFPYENNAKRAENPCDLVTLCTRNNMLFHSTCRAE